MKTPTKGAELFSEDGRTDVRYKANRRFSQSFENA